MARRRSYDPLHLYLNSRLAGQLRRERPGSVEFRYTAEWLEPSLPCEAMSVETQEESLLFSRL